MDLNENVAEDVVKNVVPDWANKFIVKNGKIPCCGLEFEYAVLSEEVVSEHKTPEMFSTGKGNFLSITENYPDEYKNLALTHEAMEFNGFFPEGEEQCLCALKEELKIAEAQQDQECDW